MFRILENVDGTTSIFCKNSGNLLCTVPSKANSNGHQRINVVEPQPSNPKWPLYNIDEAPTNPSNEEKDDTPLTRRSVCRLSPIPLPPDAGDQGEEEQSGECVSQEWFARCLGLVATETLRSTPRHQLLAEWPLRLLSRSKAYRAPEPRDVKIPDQLPLTSCLGVRVLRLCGDRAFVGADRLRAHLRSYESFCRHPWNAACPTSCHFPKLRCREKKTYPVVVSSRVLRHSAHCHTYTRGRRQRRERERTRRTGLDARSRRLLRLCNRRPATVEVTPLPESEIRDWLSRRTATPPTLAHSDEEEEEQDPSYRPPKRPTNASSRSRREARINQWRRSTSIVTPKCSVYVRNVVMDIQRNRGAHYVKGTRIRVPFFTDFLSSLRTNGPLLSAAVHKANATPDGALDDICILSSGTPGTAGPGRTPQTDRGGTQKAGGNKVLNRGKEDFCVLPPSKGRGGRPPVKATPAGRAVPDVLSMQWPPEESAGPRGTARSGNESLKQLYQPPGRTDQKAKRFRPLCERPAELWNPNPAAESDESLFDADPSACGSGFAWQKTKPPRAPSKGVRAPRDSRGMFVKTSRKKARVVKVDTDSSAFKRLLLDPQKPFSESSSSSDSDSPIPVIDLTGETTPPRKTVPSGVHRAPPKSLTPSGHRPGASSSRTGPRGQQPAVAGKRPLFPTSAPGERFRVSRWRFRCFACGFRRLFLEGEGPPAVEGAVREHLGGYHNVGDVEAYLSRYLDSVNHCAVIEAFPGFKGADD